MKRKIDKAYINNRCPLCNSFIKDEEFFCQKCLTDKVRLVEKCTMIPIVIKYKAFLKTGRTVKVIQELEINENLTIAEIEHTLALTNDYKSVFVYNIERKINQ